MIEIRGAKYKAIINESVIELIKFMKSKTLSISKNWSSREIGYFCRTVESNSIEDFCNYIDQLKKCDKSKMQVYAKLANKYTKHVKNKLVVSHVGFIPNVPAYIAGLPLDMFTFKKQPAKAKALTIIINCSFPWNKEEDDIYKSSIVILMIISILKKNGYILTVYNLRYEFTEFDGYGRGSYTSDYTIDTIFGCKVYDNLYGYNFSQIITTTSSSIYLRKAKFAFVELFTTHKDQGGGALPYFIHEKGTEYFNSYFNKDCLAVCQHWLIDKVERIQGLDFLELENLAIECAAEIIAYDFSKVKHVKVRR